MSDEEKRSLMQLVKQWRALAKYEFEHFPDNREIMAEVSALHKCSVELEETLNPNGQ